MHDETACTCRQLDEMQTDLKGLTERILSSIHVASPLPQPASVAPRAAGGAISMAAEADDLFR